MKSVTQRIKEIKQPTGGYINPKEFKIIKLEDQIELNNEENINPGLVGLAVDYMTRFMNNNDKENAFKISLMGALEINELKKAQRLLENIVGLDNQSIINACKLCGYDVCYRAGIAYFKNVDEINPDENTIFNIKVMIERGLKFFQKYGPVVQDGITFKGGYTSVISAGDADFITEDTLWDFKVSKNNPTKEYTLQLIIYYLLGIHSYSCDFSKIKKIGIFNPRKNIIYQYEIENIPKEIIKEIEQDVIGYKKIKQNDINTDVWTISDIMSQLHCSRYTVMRFYSESDLPLYKEKNKYVINKIDFIMWQQKMKKLKEEREKQQFILMIFLMLFILFILFFTIKRLLY